MILIKKSHIRFLFVISLFTTIILSLAFYLIINNVDFRNIINIKYYSEILIFMMITALLLYLLLFFTIYYKSLRVYSELDKIIENSRGQSIADNSRSFKKLDKLGAQIEALFFNLNGLSERRKLKITSFKKLCDFLIAGFHAPVIVADPVGEIMGYSDILSNKFKINPQTNHMKNITEIINVDLSSLYAKMLEEKKEITLEKVNFTDHSSKTNKIKIFPIFNSEGGIGFFIFEFNQ